MAKKSNILMLFSDTVDKSISRIVRRISAGQDVLHFHTAPKSSRDVAGMTEWIHAWKLPDSHEWMVDRHCLLPQQARIALVKTPVMANVSFFDALHYCAVHEKSEIVLGARDVPTLHIAHFMHYADAARKSGQPLDVAGIPHPAAQGNILTGGQFEQEQADIADGTADIDLLKDEVGGKILTMLTRDLFDPKAEQGATAKAIAARAEKTVTEAVKQKITPEDIKDYNSYEKDFLKAYHHASVASDALAHAVSWEFKPIIRGGGNSDLNFAVKAFSFAVVAPFIPVAYIASAITDESDPLTGFEPAFRSRLRKCEKAIKQISDRPQKKILQDFLDLAPKAWAFEEAACAYVRISNRGGRNLAVNLVKELPLVDRIAELSGLSVPEKEALRADFLAGRFIAPGAYKDKFSGFLRQAAAASEQDWKEHRLRVAQDAVKVEKVQLPQP